MLEVPDEIQVALRSHQRARVYGVATDPQGRVRELRIRATGSVSYQASGEVQSTSSVLVVGQSDSLKPRLRTDPLAPFGQEITLFRELILREGETFQIPLGVFRIIGNDGGRETRRFVSPPPPTSEPDALLPMGAGLWAVPFWLVETEPDSGIYPADAFPEVQLGLRTFNVARVADTQMTGVVTGWSVQVDLADRMRGIVRAKLLDRLSPVPGNTMYDELRRLSLFPVQQTVQDRSVPATLVYEDRMQAIRALADLAGCRPQVTREGVMVLKEKDSWLLATTPVFDISATIPDGWQDPQTDDFVNVVRATSDDERFVGWATIDDPADPLSVPRTWPVTYELSSPLITSQSGAVQAAETALRRLRVGRSRRVTVECLPEAVLLELGDFGWMRDPVNGRAVLGEVSAVDVPLDPTETVPVELIVAEVG